MSFLPSVLIVGALLFSAHAVRAQHTEFWFDRDMSMGCNSAPEDMAWLELRVSADGSRTVVGMWFFNVRMNRPGGEWWFSSRATIGRPAAERAHMNTPAACAFLRQAAEAARVEKLKHNRARHALKLVICDADVPPPDAGRAIELR